MTVIDPSPMDTPARTTDAGVARWRQATGVLLLVGLLLAACQSQPPASPGAPTSTRAPGIAINGPGGGTLIIALNSEPVTLDPEASASSASGGTFFITSSVGESLLYLDERGELKPWLADSWEISDGGATFTFKLRQDVTFQDGTAFNAAAVKWNFDRVVDPSYKAGQALSFLADYQGTEVLDAFTARVRFNHPAVQFLDSAASPQLAMLSPTATARQGDQVNREPVMTGAYKVDDWISRDHITMSRWDGYTRKTPWSAQAGAGHLDQIIWRFIPDPSTRATAVESGEVHAAVLYAQPDAPRLAAEGLQIARSPWAGAGLNLLLNVTKPPTDDQRVRQAIAYALDREAQLSVYDGTTAIGPLTAATLDETSLHTYYPHDLSKAAELLDQAGWTLGSDGIRTRDGQKLEFLLNAHIEMATGGGPYPLIQGELREAGIDVTIKAQAQAAFAEDNYKCANNGALTSGPSTGGLDALYSLFHSSNVGGPFNYSCLKNAEVDQALEQGRREVDPARRKQIYVQLEQKLLEMAVVVPLVDQAGLFALRPNVSGVKFSGYSYPLLTDVVLTS